MPKIEVEIHSSRPLYVQADADSFGALFAHMCDDDQVEVLAAMVRHMSKHPLQWDYLSLRLEADEHAETRDALRRLLFPEVL